MRAGCASALSFYGLLQRSGEGGRLGQSADDEHLLCPAGRPDIAFFLPVTFSLPPGAKTPRDKLLEVPPRNCRYGRDIGIPVRWGWGRHGLGRID